MCGIAGFSKGTDLTRFLTPTILLHVEARGKDSWGVTDGDYTYKHLGPVSESFEEFGLNSCIYHTRAASVGKATLRNAHPFTAEANGKKVVGIHNGCITNYEDLKKKYPERAGFEVDSEHIFAHLAEGKDLGELGGWGNLAWYEMPVGKPQRKTLHFSCFNNDALHIARLPEGEIVFASTQQSIVQACRFAGVKPVFYKVERDTHYSVGERGLIELGKLPWSKNVYHEPVVLPARGSGKSWGRSWDSSPRDSEHCALKGCFNKVSEKELICIPCIKKLAEEYVGVTA